MKYTEKIMAEFDTIDKDFLRNRAALKWRPLGEEVNSLSVADIDFSPPKEIKDGIIKAVEEDRTPDGDYGGDPDVLTVVCGKR